MRSIVVSCFAFHLYFFFFKGILYLSIKINSSRSHSCSRFLVSDFDVNIFFGYQFLFVSLSFLFLFFCFTMSQIYKNYSSFHQSLPFFLHPYRCLLFLKEFSVSSDRDIDWTATIKRWHLDKQTNFFSAYNFFSFVRACVKEIKHGELDLTEGTKSQLVSFLAAHLFKMPF